MVRAIPLAAAVEVLVVAARLALSAHLELRPAVLVEEAHLELMAHRALQLLADLGRLDAGPVVEAHLELQAHPAHPALAVEAAPADVQAMAWISRRATLWSGVAAAFTPMPNTPIRLPIPRRMWVKTGSFWNR